MISVLSATENDFYAMPLPFAVYSWIKAGFRSIVFIPKGDNPKLALAKKYCNSLTTFYEFDAEEKRIPTFSQVIRLFGFATEIGKLNESTLMVTSDSDICVFGDIYKTLDNGELHVIGSDLTPPDQFPMCFLGMPVSTWKDIFGNGHEQTYQDYVAELINPIEGMNIRGEQWCYDQWYAHKKIRESRYLINHHNRAKEHTQFAKQRADRDGWYFDANDIIDAHLPRPLTKKENFDRVYDLFKIKYPNDDLQWMIDYYEAYKKLL